MGFLSTIVIMNSIINTTNNINNINKNKSNLGSDVSEQLKVRENCDRFEVVKKNLLNSTSEKINLYQDLFVDLKVEKISEFIERKYSTEKGNFVDEKSIKIIASCKGLKGDRFEILFDNLDSLKIRKGQTYNFKVKLQSVDLREGAEKYAIYLLKGEDIFN